MKNLTRCRVILAVAIFMFGGWQAGAGVTLVDPSIPTTYFTMSSSDVTVTATYKDAVATILDHPTMYADVVFSNGKACSLMEVQYLTAEQIADVCGVAFKVEDGAAKSVDI